MESVDPKTKPDLYMSAGRGGMGLALAPDIELSAPASFSIAVPYATASVSASGAQGSKSVQGTGGLDELGLDELAGTAGLHGGQSTELDDRSATRTG